MSIFFTGTLLNPVFSSRDDGIATENAHTQETFVLSSLSSDARTPTPTTSPETSTSRTSTSQLRHMVFDHVGFSAFVGIPLHHLLPKVRFVDSCVLQSYESMLDETLRTCRFPMEPIWRDRYTVCYHCELLNTNYYVKRLQKTPGKPKYCRHPFYRAVEPHWGLYAARVGHKDTHAGGSFEGGKKRVPRRSQKKAIVRNAHDVQNVSLETLDACIAEYTVNDTAVLQSATVCTKENLPIFTATISTAITTFADQLVPYMPFTTASDMSLVAYSFHAICTTPTISNIVATGALLLRSFKLGLDAQVWWEEKVDYLSRCTPVADIPVFVRAPRKGELLASRSLYEEFRKEFDTDESALTADMEQISGISSAFINSPLGQEVLQFFARMVYMGILKREWAQISFSGVKVWELPPVQPHTATALTLFDNFVALAVKIRKSILQCIAEKSILPLAYDDQDLRKLDKLFRQISVLAPNLSSGNLKALHGLDEQHYEIMVDDVHKLCKLMLARKNPAWLSGDLKNKEKQLSLWKDECHIWANARAGRVSPFTTVFFGGTKVGKTSMARVYTTTLLNYNGFVPFGLKPEVATISEADKYDSTIRSSTQALLYEDAGNAKRDVRATAPADLIIRHTGPEAKQAIKADIQDKGKVMLNAKFFTITTNVEDLCAHADSNCPESILRRAHLHVEVEAYPWLTDASGDTFSDRLVTQYMQDDIYKACSAQETQLFNIRTIEVKPARNGGTPEIAYTTVVLDSERFPKTARIYDNSIERMLEKGQMCVEDGFFPYHGFAHDIFEASVEEARTSCELRMVPYSVLVAFAAECSEKHFAGENFRLDNQLHNEEKAMLCPRCMLMRAACSCQLVDARDDDSFVSSDEDWKNGNDCDNSVCDGGALQAGRIRNCSPVMRCPRASDERLRARSVPFDPIDVSLPTVREEVEPITWFTRVRSFFFPRGVDNHFLNVPGALVELTPQRVFDMLGRVILRKALGAAELYTLWQCGKATARLLTFYRLACMALSGYCVGMPFGHINGVFTAVICVLLYVGLAWTYYKGVTQQLIVRGHRLVLTDERCVRVGQFAIGGVALAGVIWCLARKYFSPKLQGGVQSSYNMSPRMDLVQNKKVSTMTSDQVVRKVQKNMGKIIVECADGTRRCTNTICLGSNVYVFPRHLVEWEPHTYAIQMNSQTPTYMVPFDATQVHYVEGRDLAALRSHAGGTRADICHLFPKLMVSDTRKRFGTLVMPRWTGRGVEHLAYQMGQKLRHVFNYKKFVPDANRRDYVVGHTKYTNMGDCCSAIVADDANERSVVGLLFGKGGGDRIYCEPLTSSEAAAIVANTPSKCSLQMASFAAEWSDENVDDAEPHYKAPTNFLAPGGNFEVLGSYAPKENPRPQIGNTLVTSRVKELFPETEGLDFVAPPFRYKENGEKNWPFTLALEDVVTADATYHVRYLDEITSEYLDRIRPHICKQKRGPCTRQEIQVGIRGGSLSPMNMRTSAGFPHYKKKVEFSEFTGAEYILDDAVWEEFDRLDAALRRGVRINMIFRATLKNEPVLKGANKKARVFCAGPMLGTMLVRKYFGPLISFFHENQVITECACGVDALSPGWERLFEPHMMRTNAIAFDYKKFDRQVTAAMKATVAYILVELLKAQGFEGEDLVASQTLLAEYVEVTLAIEGAVIRLFSMMPSGFPLTTIGNSIDNSMRVRSAFKLFAPDKQFSQYCSLTTYGDDAVLTTDIPELTLPVLATHMYALHVVITDTEKSGELVAQNLTWRDVSFLSRKSVYHEKLGYHVGALQNSSLYKGLLARDVSRKAIGSFPHFVSALSSFVIELFAHGEERYEREIILARQLAREYGADETMVDRLDWSYDQHVIARKERDHDEINQMATPDGRFAKDGSDDEDYGDGELLARTINRTSTFWARERNRIYGLDYPSTPGTNGQHAGQAVVPYHISPTTIYEHKQQNAEQDQTITRFEDVSQGWSEGSYIDDPSRGGTDAGDVPLGEFFSRPQRLFTYTWLPTSGVLVDSVWDQALMHPRMLDKLEGYANFRGSLHLKFTINGSRFHAGHMVVAYKPIANSMNFAANETTFVNACRALQCQHITLSPTECRGGELTLPFVHEHDMLDIAQGTLSQIILRRMGTLMMVPLVPLSRIGATNGIDNVRINVYAHFSNVVLSGATAIGSLQNEVVDTKLSSKLNSFANFAGLFKNVPVIGRYAQATEMAAGASAHVAAHYGFSQPSKMPQVDKYHRGYGDAFSTAHQESSATALTYNPKSEVTIDPTTVGLPGVDELAFKHLIRKPGLLNTFTWGPDSPALTTLKTYRVSPVIGPLNDVRGNRVMTPLEHVATPFTYWRGSMCFRFQIIASGLITGRLIISYDCENDLESQFRVNNMPATRNLVVDLSERRDITVEIPWSSNWMYKLVNAKSAAKAALSDSLATIHAQNLDSMTNGTLKVGVETPLSGPDGLGPIEVVTTVFSRDMEFFDPRITNIPDFEIVDGITGEPQVVDDPIPPWNSRWTPFNPLLESEGITPSSVPTDPPPDPTPDVSAGNIRTVAAPDLMPVYGPWVELGANLYNQIQFDQVGTPVSVLNDVYIGPSGNSTLKMTFERNSVNPGVVEFLDQELTGVIDQFDYADNNTQHEFTVVVEGTPGTMIRTHHKFRISQTGVPTRIRLVSMEYEEPPDATHVSIEFDDQQNVDAGATIQDTHAEHFNDYTIVAEDVCVKYDSAGFKSPMHIVLREAEATINGVTLPGRGSNRTYHYGLLSVRDITSPLFISAGRFRRLVYLKNKGTLQAEQIENVAEHAPVSDDITEMAELSRPFGIEKICYDDPIVSWRTMLKREQLSGFAVYGAGVNHIVRPDVVPWVPRGGGTASRTLMGYVAMNFAAYRGSVRKKLVPLNGGVTTYAVMRNVGDINVDTRGDTGYSAFALPENVEGMELFPGTDVGHVTIPYHKPYRYTTNRNLAVDFDVGKRDMGYKISVNAAQRGAFAEYTSTGEDFNFYGGFCLPAIRGI